MAVFSEQSFRDLLDRLIVICPMERSCITGVGYDLRIGYCISINPKLKTIKESREIMMQDDNIIYLDRDTYLIVVSREFVYLSSRVAATFHSKSSLAAQGVFLNSTTGDPNWQGRLIFVLYNASGRQAEVEADQTFGTMVVHNTERRSLISPANNPQTVLAKYTRGFRGDFSKAFEFLLRNDAVKQEFSERVARAMRFANRPFPFVLCSTAYYRYVFPRRKAVALTCLLLVLAAVSGYIAHFKPQFLKVGRLQDDTLSRIGSWCSIISLVLALLFPISAYVVKKFRRRQ